MIPGLGPTAAGAIDAFLNKHCGNPANFGELQQLRQLFTWQFRRGLERLLNRTLLHSEQPIICDVQICWIDKIPIARASSLTKGTEIGDAVIFSFDQRVDPVGNILSLNARAAMLQAKIATDPAQIATPIVPVNYTSSTQNELQLLSNWPVFNLRATGASKTDLLRGVTVAPPINPAPHAWFIAAPGTMPVASKGWPSWWMAGRALSGDPCTTTLGQLLVAFLEPSNGNPEVGFPFKSVLRGNVPFANLGPPTDWCDLCNAIKGILPCYGAPKSIFRLPPGHMGPNFPRGYSIPRHASSYIAAGPSGLRLVQENAAELGANSPASRATDPFRSIRFGGPIVPENRDSGMFILTVTTTRIETVST